MEEKNMQSQIDELNRKMDIILEEIHLQKRRRLEMEDLQEDLMRVGTDVYHSAVEELEEVHDHITTGDMMYLMKKLLRNVKNITRTFEQLENAKDFIDDFAPVSREMILDFMAKMDEFDRKGYFEFMKQMMKGVDNVVETFSVDDVKNLSDNLVTILNTIKNLTQPDMLHAVNNAVSVYKNLDVTVEKDVSIISLIKELNKPETKRGLAFGIEFLKNLSTIQNKQLNK